MIRIVQKELFTVESAFIDWFEVLRRRKVDDHLFRLFREGERSRHTVALRWHVAAHRGNLEAGEDRGIGLPTGPFTVWRRRSFASDREHPVSFDVAAVALLGVRIVQFHEELATARLAVDSSSGGSVFGLADGSNPLSIVTRSTAPAGNAMIELHGRSITGVVLPDDMDLASVEGVSTADYAELDDWEAVEVVGFPVDPQQWAGIGDHDRDQGLVVALTDPRSAAEQRLTRGGPVLGWDDEVEPGVTAPLWEPPDTRALLDDLDAELLGRLRDVLQVQQTEQILEVFGVEVPRPETLDGDRMPGAPSSADVSPVKVVQMAVGTDPFLSLALGFGTNLDEGEELMEDAQVKPYHDGSRYDYMVTAPYRNGLDGESEEVELVAYALRPTRAVPPPAPVALTAEHRAHEAPSGVDSDWRSSAIVSWARPLSTTTLYRSASHAATRHDLGATEARPLMPRRGAGGFEPLAPAFSELDAELNRVHVTDTRFSVPNDPGSRALRYSVATQDLFGLWSTWRSCPHSSTQPDPTPPLLVSARLDLEVPATGTVCPGSLVVDFTWDWSLRRPRRIVLRGRMFAAASRTVPPPSTAVPAGLARTIDGLQPSVTVEFTGDTATVDGLVTPRLQYLSPGGGEEVQPGTAQSDEIRRYRLTISDLAVDFAATPHAGLALWIDGDERRAPHHHTAATGPLVIHVSDPIPKLMSPPIVPLGSLPDAEGRSHGKIAWPAVPGASGYHVYESDELTFLAHWGEPEPPVDATLTDRFAVVLDRWATDPDRRPFTRLTSRPVTGTALDVAIPRGSRAIHTYVVITTGPGGVEGPWPSSGDPTTLVALAAPRVASPPPPDLVARPAPSGAGSVAVALTTRLGHPVARIDLHRVRVDDAARDFETMGPPVATVTGTGGGGWTRDALADGRIQLAGVDSPGESWRRVWYRAVAWGQPDPQRGLVAARSEPSNPFSLVVPPTDPPDLSPVTLEWPGGSIGDVELQFNSAAPSWRTALGPHRLELRLDDVTDAGAATRALDLAADLDRLPAVPPTTGDGWWRVAGSNPGAYRVLLRRTSPDQALRGALRLVDPLGRVTQRRVEVPAGAVLPAPDLGELTVVTIAGRGTILSFTSASPTVATGAGPYLLRVVATRASTGWFPFPFPGVGLPPLLRPRTVSVELPLHEIPTVTSLPGGVAPLVLVRQRGVGPPHTYAAIARVEVTRFAVRLVGPDGRSAIADVEVT